MSWYPSYDEEAWGRTEHPDEECEDPDCPLCHPKEPEEVEF